VRPSQARLCRGLGVYSLVDAPSSMLDVDLQANHRCEDFTRILFSQYHTVRPHRAGQSESPERLFKNIVCLWSTTFFSTYLGWVV
jgi:hypothetical protein